MNLDKEVLIAAESVRRFLKKELATSIEELDLYPERAQSLDLLERLSKVLPINEPGAELLSPLGVAWILWEISRECAGIAALTAYWICGEFIRKTLFPKIPSKVVAISLFEDGDSGIDEGVLKFHTEFTNNCLTGIKRSVFLAPLASHFTVFARGKDKNLVAMVKSEGIIQSPSLKNIGIRALPCADIRLEKMKVSDWVEVEMAHILCLLGILSLFSTACACGTAFEALDRAWEYAKGRYQAGKLIREHHAIQLAYEENLSRVIQARDAILSASARLDSQDLESLKNAIRTKIACGRIFVNATLDAIQIMGGYGYMRDYGIEKRFRDCVALSLLPLDNTRLSLFLNSLNDSVPSSTLPP